MTIVGCRTNLQPKSRFLAGGVEKGQPNVSRLVKQRTRAEIEISDRNAVRAAAPYGPRRRPPPSEPLPDSQDAQQIVMLIRPERGFGKLP